MSVVKIQYNKVLSHAPTVIDYSKYFKNKKNNLYIPRKVYIKSIDNSEKSEIDFAQNLDEESISEMEKHVANSSDSDEPPIFLPFVEKYEKKYDLRKMLKMISTNNFIAACRVTTVGDAESIPKIIYQTWRTKMLPPYMSAAVENLKRKNPDFEHRLFDDDDCRDFILKHFGEPVVRAYDYLIPGAFRADLWRYCALFVTGGVYIDIKFEPLAGCNLAEMIDREHYCLGLRDAKNFRIYNAFMICRPKNPLLFDAIYKIVEHVKTGYMGTITLQITGPMLLGSLFKRENNEDGTDGAVVEASAAASVANEKNDHYMKSISLYIVTEPRSGNADGRQIANIAWISNKRRIFREYAEYREEQRTTDILSHYNVLYEKKMVFRTNDVGIYNSKIPAHVYQTWHTKKLAPGMKECIEVLREQNPEFTFHFFDDAECRDFIAANFDESVVRAFDAIVPGAYKADLWRYCVLYVRGGIYLDCKYVGCYDFKFAKFLDKEYFVLDNNEKDIYNAFMICRAGNPILRECIQKIVEYVAEEYYGENPLHITGPVLLRQIYCKYFSLDDLVLRHRVKGAGPTEGGDLTRAVIEGRATEEQLLGVYPNYRFEQRHYQNKEHYDVYWRARTVYDKGSAAAAAAAFLS